MKIAVLILIECISCTLKCEANKTDAENKTERPPRYMNQTGDEVVPEAAWQLHDLNQTRDFLTTDTVGQLYDTRKRKKIVTGKGGIAYVMASRAFIHVLDWSNHKSSAKPRHVKPHYMNQPKYEKSTNIFNVTESYIMASRALINKLKWSNSTLPIHIERRKYEDTIDLIENVTRDYIETSETPIPKLDELNPPLEHEDSIKMIGNLSRGDIKANKTRYPELDQFKLPLEHENTTEKIIRNNIKTSKAVIPKLDELNSPLQFKSTTEMMENIGRVIEVISRDYVKTAKTLYPRFFRLNSTLPVNITLPRSVRTTTMEIISRNYIKTNETRFPKFYWLSSTTPIHTAHQSYVETTGAVTLLDSEEQPAHTIITNAAGEAVISTKSTSETPAKDRGPAIIKVEDALKILEMSKSQYAQESIALIRRLERLRSTYNVTELMLDHKISLDEFALKKMLRSGVEDWFKYLRRAILDRSSKFDNIIVPGK